VHLWVCEDGVWCQRQALLIPNNMCTNGVQKQTQLPACVHHQPIVGLPLGGQRRAPTRTTRRHTQTAVSHRLAEGQHRGAASRHLALNAGTHAHTCTRTHTNTQLAMDTLCIYPDDRACQSGALCWLCTTVRLHACDTAKAVRPSWLVHPPEAQEGGGALCEWEQHRTNAGGNGAHRWAMAHLAGQGTCPR